MGETREDRGFAVRGLIGDVERKSGWKLPQEDLLEYLINELLYKGVRVKLVGTFTESFDVPHWRAQMDDRHDELSVQGSTPLIAVLKLTKELAVQGLLWEQGT